MRNIFIIIIKQEDVISDTVLATYNSKSHSFSEYLKEILFPDGGNRSSDYSYNVHFIPGVMIR